MRPGQETPDEAGVGQRFKLEQDLPSMRPGQETPDEVDGTITVATHVHPSMRPGQETPDEALHVLGDGLLMTPSFNEAGARNPG